MRLRICHSKTIGLKDSIDIPSWFNRVEEESFVAEVTPLFEEVFAELSIRPVEPFINITTDVSGLSEKKGQHNYAVLAVSGEVYFKNVHSGEFLVQEGCCLICDPSTLSHLEGTGLFMFTPIEF